MKKLQFVFRAFKKNWKLTLISVFCMALGLASAGIILSYIYQEYNYDNDTFHAERIYRVIEKDGEKLNPYTFGPLAQSLKQDYPEIEDASRVSIYYGTLACSAGETKINENEVIFADSSFFDLFSFPLIKGNSKDCLRSPNSLVISEKAANKYFGQDDPIGQILQIGDTTEYVVTAVFENFKTHSNFRGDLVLPLEKISKLTQVWIDPGWNYESDIYTFVLIADHGAISDLVKKSENHLASYIPDTEIKLQYQALKDIHVNRQVFWESSPQVDVKYLYILLIVAILILGISLVNFLFLYIGTSSQRALGIGIKKVYGASKAALFQDHFLEITLLTLLSMVTAIVLYGIYHAILIRHFSFLPQIGLFDYKLALLLAGTVAITALLAGIYPSILLSSQKPVSLFREQKIARKGKFTLINLLVVIQFTFCIALMVSTLMMHKQTNYMAGLDTGMDTKGLITIPINMNAADMDNSDAFVQELKKYPGIKNLSFSYSSPSSINSMGDDAVSWEGKTEDTEVLMSWESVSWDYFKTIGINVVRGRTFSRNYPNDPVNWDTRQCAYVINESAVEKMGLADPIGKEFEVWGFRGSIIGIVEDYHFRSMHAGIGPLYFQINPIFWSQIVVRIDPASTSAINDIQTVWTQFFPDFPLEINYENNQILSFYTNDRNLAKTLSAFSILAILIASMGLFTLSVLSLDQRTKEIGIRKVNGAANSQILALVNKDFLKLILLAFILATPLAWFATHKWLENFANKTSLSWWVFALAGIFAMAISVITVSWKSRQVTRKNPVEALRYE
jgi:putative ABC transport system permease protein